MTDFRPMIMLSTFVAILGAVTLSSNFLIGLTIMAIGFITALYGAKLQTASLPRCVPCNVTLKHGAKYCHQCGQPANSEEPPKG